MIWQSQLSKFYLHVINFIMSIRRTWVFFICFRSNPIFIVCHVCSHFTNFMRLEPRMFHELLLRFTPRLTKQETNMRHPLDPGLKLAIILRYMATGDIYNNLCYSFRVPHNTISGVVKGVSAAILAEYKKEIFKFPTTPQRWREVCDIRLFQKWLNIKM